MKVSTFLCVPSSCATVFVVTTAQRAHLNNGFEIANCRGALVWRKGQSRSAREIGVDRGTTRPVGHSENFQRVCPKAAQLRVWREKGAVLSKILVRCSAPSPSSPTLHAPQPCAVERMTSFSMAVPMIQIMIIQRLHARIADSAGFQRPQFCPLEKEKHGQQ